MFDKPKSVFQQKIKEILTKEHSADIVKEVFKLQLLKQAEKDESLLHLVELYELLGLAKFVDVLSLLEGQTIKFPTKEDLTDTIQLALCYYYRNLEGKEWPEIKQVLQDPDLPSIKYGIRLQQFQSFLDYIAARADAKRRGFDTYDEC